MWFKFGEYFFKFFKKNWLQSIFPTIDHFRQWHIPDNCHNATDGACVNIFLPTVFWDWTEIGILLWNTTSDIPQEHWKELLIWLFHINSHIKTTRRWGEGAPPTFPYWTKRHMTCSLQVHIIDIEFNSNHSNPSEMRYGLVFFQLGAYHQ